MTRCVKKKKHQKREQLNWITLRQIPIVHLPRVKDSSRSKNLLMTVQRLLGGASYTAVWSNTNVNPQAATLIKLPLLWPHSLCVCVYTMCVLVHERWCSIKRHCIFLCACRKQYGGEPRISSTLDATLLQAPLLNGAPAFLKVLAKLCTITHTHTHIAAFNAKLAILLDSFL